MNGICLGEILWKDWFCPSGGVSGNLTVVSKTEHLQWLGPRLFQSVIAKKNLFSNDCSEEH